LRKTAFLLSLGWFWNFLPTRFENPQNGVFCIVFC